MPKAVLALGSNIPPAKENIDRAIEALSALGTVKEVAPYIVSKPEGFAEQPDFINTVLILSTPYQPLPLLKKLKALETRLGRTPTFKNGPRVIDLDILFYDDQVLFEDDDEYPLFIPHPRLQEREFVLKPLSYILSDFVHPKLGKPVYRLYRELMKKKGKPDCHIL
ncbi:2-amino-4-hydroxy-6-hydroxymethyldihydropteridine diphosphokinase [Candidatus Avelusimicrobium gallicola]|uniref:2-amino-4-hydroxy-6-hydroxymethyldihydropteridine pyrophosphokinase n=1 Tax=Candidatus Avelusimicrobium gallicola TaxID=2562704 RepID=A0A1Y4DBF9_9BACT|nr:2-amino-4-hydroxy-6-hydroxymethyldihydropteridine diphosphokinase [Elusimicrobium sp. An273]OUO56494.1 2-amino-4-hydroxy-6-hydroxymethyldihydropteridine diphosphokinase [Elusimicrobium sp. An273]